MSASCPGRGVFKEAIEAVIHHSKVKLHLSDATAQVIQGPSIPFLSRNKAIATVDGRIPAFTS